MATSLWGMMAGRSQRTLPSRMLTWESSSSSSAAEALAAAAAAAADGDGSEVTQFKLLAVVVVILISLLGSFLPLRLSAMSDSLRRLVMEQCRFFTAGVFLGVGLLHMLPEATEGLQALLLQPGPASAPLALGLEGPLADAEVAGAAGGRWWSEFPLAQAICCLGFMLVWFVEKRVAGGVPAAAAPGGTALAPDLDQHRMVAVAAGAESQGGANLCIVHVASVASYGPHSCFPSTLSPALEPHGEPKGGGAAAAAAPPTPSDSTVAPKPLLPFLLLPCAAGASQQKGSQSPSQVSRPSSTVAGAADCGSLVCCRCTDAGPPGRDVNGKGEGDSEGRGGVRDQEDKGEEPGERTALLSPHSHSRSQDSVLERAAAGPHASSWWQPCCSKDRPRRDEAADSHLLHCRCSSLEDLRGGSLEDSQRELGGRDGSVLPHQWSPGGWSGVPGGSPEDACAGLHRHVHESGHRHVVMQGSGALSLLLAVLFSLHSFVVGAALGTETHRRGAVGLIIAIMAHKGAEAFAVGVQFVKEGVPVGKMVVVMLIYCTMTPLGILLGMVAGLVQGAAGALVADITQAFGAGTVLYIVMMELGDESSRTGSLSPLMQLMLFALGVTIMAAVSVFV